MATLNPSVIPLNQTNITGRRNPVVTLNSLRKRYKTNKQTQERTDELEGFTADICARNSLQSVKLPIDAVDESTFNKINEALEAEKIVKINFGATASTLRGKYYGLINKSTGLLVQGISCTATELNLVAIEDPEADDIDEYEIDLN